MGILEDYCKAFDWLSPDNQERLPVVEWLVSPDDRDRRSGRSSLIAMGLVRAAASGRPVRLFDHHSGPAKDSVRNMESTLRALFPSGYEINGQKELKVLSDAAFPPRDALLYSGQAVRNLEADFKAVARTLLRSGVSHESLLSMVNESVVRDVMET